MGLFSAFSLLAAIGPEDSLSTPESHETVTFHDSPLNFAIDLEYVPVRYPFYSYDAGTRTGKFGNGGRVSAEWIPYAGSFGKIGIGLGVGYGTLANVPLTNGTQSSITVYPLDFFLTYRLDYFNNQFIVPYGKIGPSFSWMNQAGGEIKFYSGLDLALGLAVCLDWIDLNSAQIFDKAVGVNNTYLFAEVINSRFLAGENQPNLQRENELRFGLRFEI
jgi:hypothetical protein